MPDFAAQQINALRRYRSVITRYLHLLAKRHGIAATDLSALSYLTEAKRTGVVLSPGDLAEMLSLSGPATTSVIDRLEATGHVERRANPNDGRRLEIHLLDSFEVRPSRSIFAGLGTIYRGVLQQHTQAEVDTFTKILTEVTEAVAIANSRADDPAAEHLWGPYREV